MKFLIKSLSILLIIILCLSGLLIACQKATTTPGLTETSSSEITMDSISTSTIAESSSADSSSDQSSAEASSQAEPTSATPSKVQTSSAASSASTSQENLLIKKKVSSIGFGYYGLSTDYLGYNPIAEELMATDYINTILLTSNIEDMVYGLQAAKKNNCKVWVSIHESLFTTGSALSGLWETRFDAIDAAARNSGAYDALLGYYLDEPLLCGISHADLLMITKYNHDNFKKRFFICFAVSGVAPELYNTSYASPPITAETGKYLTDVAFDYYIDFSVPAQKTNFETCISNMKTRIGRTDVKVWYVPLIMNGGGKTKEQVAIDHINACYEYLKKEANPGGLMCYTYKTSADGDGLGNIGLGEMADNIWTTLRSECIRIGRDICTGKLGK